MRIFLPFEIPNRHRRMFNTLQEHFGIEYSDIIDLVCGSWDELHVPARDELMVFYEALLSNLAVREIEYRALIAHTRLFSAAVDVIYDELHPSLSTVISDVYRDRPVDMRLIGWARYAPVIEMMLRPSQRHTGP